MLDWKLLDQTTCIRIAVVLHSLYSPKGSKAHLQISTGAEGISCSSEYDAFYPLVNIESPVCKDKIFRHPGRKGIPLLRSIQRYYLDWGCAGSIFRMVRDLDVLEG